MCQEFEINQQMIKTKRFSFKEDCKRIDSVDQNVVFVSVKALRKMNDFE